MMESRLLTPREAEAVVDERIEAYGLDALPRVSVTEIAARTWRVRWEHREATVAAMDSDAWHAWLEENVGSLDSGDLDTSEG